MHGLQIPREHLAPVSTCWQRGNLCCQFFFLARARALKACGPPVMHPSPCGWISHLKRICAGVARKRSAADCTGGDASGSEGTTTDLFKSCTGDCSSLLSSSSLLPGPTCSRGWLQLESQAAKTCGFAVSVQKLWYVMPLSKQNWRSSRS